MNHITNDTVAELAKLARLTLSHEEIDKYQTDLVEVLEYINTISKYSVSKTTTLTPDNRVREDENKPIEHDKATLLANFPETAKNMVVVPKVLDRESGNS